MTSNEAVIGLARLHTLNAPSEFGSVQPTEGNISDHPEVAEALKDTGATYFKVWWYFVPNLISVLLYTEQWGLISRELVDSRTWRIR